MTQSAPQPQSTWYQRPKTALRQGDIALAEFHQLRAKGGEPIGPADSVRATRDMPYLGPYQDFQVDVALPGDDRKIVRVLRVWVGLALLLHQSCEIEYADEGDSRLVVAPLVWRRQWTAGPWDLIEKGELPGFLYLPSLPEDEAAAAGCKQSLPEAAVAFASTTLVSRGIFKPNRLAALRPERLAALQAAAVRFFSVRGWASTRELERLVGKTIVSADETAETVPGPSRLAKIVLSDADAPDDDEVTVTWGLRSAR